jgi:hypothetical protein
VFIHSNPQIDDSAITSKYSYQADPIGLIGLKTRFGFDCFELTVRIAKVEAGYCGTMGDTGVYGFCGSALQNLPTHITSSMKTIIAKSIYIHETRVSC